MHETMHLRQATGAVIAATFPAFRFQLRHLRQFAALSSGHFLSTQQSHRSDDGRDHAANQHPYRLVGR